MVCDWIITCTDPQSGLSLAFARARDKFYVIYDAAADVDVSLLDLSHWQEIDIRPTLKMWALGEIDPTLAMTLVSEQRAMANDLLRQHVNRKRGYPQAPSILDWLSDPRQAKLRKAS